MPCARRKPRRSAQRNQKEQERVTSATATNKRRARDGKDPNPIAAAQVEKADRATTWKTISERVAATAAEIGQSIDTAVAGLSGATAQKLGLWGTPLKGVSAQPSITIGEEPAVAAAWRDSVGPAIAALSNELKRDYRVPACYGASNGLR